MESAVSRESPVPVSSYTEGSVFAFATGVIHRPARAALPHQLLKGTGLVLLNPGAKQLLTLTARSTRTLTASA